MTNNQKRTRTAWIVAVAILSALLALFVVLYMNERNANLGNINSLENIYTKNFYDLVDNVNNTETKLAKAINATDSKMQAKYLREVSNNTRLAEININTLPYSSGEFAESLAFINQLSGYSETLSKNLEKGQSLSSKDLSTLESVYDSVLYMKDTLAEMSTKMWDGYKITQESKNFEGENNAFTNSLSKIKNVDVEYPTMIYDGPFSDSVVSKEVKGLVSSEVSQETAKENLLKIFTALAPENIEYQGEATGRFETYNFSCKNTEGKEYLYVQMTKKGGNLLTATSYSDKKTEDLSIDNASEIALNFASRAGIDNPKVVWSDEIGGNAYINIAPVQDNYILYPDLVKVKIDLANGDVLGYEATGYYTNHTKRTPVNPTITKQEAKKFVPSKYVVKEVRLALIPLEYNQEIFCWEISATMGGDEYYFYYNVENGQEENILKVLKTNNGNLLM